MHGRAEIRLAKVETDIVSVQAELETIEVDITDLENTSMSLLGIEKTLKDTIIGYEQGISDVESRTSVYSMQWGKT